MFNRDTLLKRYQQDKHLTSGQLKLLAKTNPIVIKTLDRSFIQSSINLMDEETIENVKMNIVEGIMHKYKTNKSIVENSRNKFFSKKHK